LRAPRLHFRCAPTRVVIGGNNQIADLILTLEQHPDESILELDFAESHAIEHRLDGVHEAHDVVEPEESGGAFDRVSRAEDLIDRVRSRGTTTGLQQAGLHFLQQLPRLRDEGRNDVVDVHAATPRRRSARWHNSSTSRTAALAARMRRFAPLAVASRTL